MTKKVIRWDCPIEGRSMSRALEGFSLQEALQRAEDLAGGLYAPTGASASATDGNRVLEAVCIQGNWTTDPDEVASERRAGQKWAHPLLWRNVLTAVFVDEVRSGAIGSDPFIIATGDIRPDVKTNTSLEFTITGTVSADRKKIQLTITGQMSPRGREGEQIVVPENLGEGRLVQLTNSPRLSKLAVGSIVTQLPVELFRVNANALGNRGRW